MTRLLAALLLLALPAWGQDAAPELLKDFDISWRYYEWRIEQGDDLETLKNILLRMRTRYTGTSASLELMERELAAINALQEAFKNPSEPAQKTP